MKNDGSNNKCKNKCSLLLALGIVFSLLFVFSVIAILWTVGVLNTTTKIVLAILFSLILVFAISAIIWNTRIDHKEK